MKGKKKVTPPAKPLQIDGKPPKAEKPRRGRTVILKKKTTPDAAKWVRWLEEKSIASTGPYPNVCGMRNLYWGREALIVRAGAYIYLITKRDDGRKLPWER